MVAELGTFLTGLALGTALYAVGASAVALGRRDPRWRQSGYRGTFATAGLLSLALLILLAAFLGDQFQIRYVAGHSSRALPLYLKASAIWAGQEGSLLLWAFLQALFAALVLRHPSRQSEKLVPWATLFLAVCTSFFVAVTLFLSNPFTRTGVVPTDGYGLNPLLRHPGMIFHPPALYLGYVGLAVPFAFALAGLVTHDLATWPTVARRWTLAAWLFLGLGILLGMRWAYDVLGWGGYWGWDPVENAGLMPWLTATGLLHATVMQQEGRGYRGWTVTLAALSFALVLLGTFTTRSGLIQSVHAFARSDLGYPFLGAILVSLLTTAGLAMWHRHAQAPARINRTPAEDRAESLLSRDSAFFLTLILLLTLTGSVLVGSLLPTLTGGRFVAGSEWFDRVTGPQFGALVLVLGVCPLLGRAAGSLRRLKKRGLPALMGAVAVPTIAWLTGFSFTPRISLLAFAVVGLAGGTLLVETWRDAAAASRRRGTIWLVALLHLIGRNRRKYGGGLVHTGVILLGLGVIGTRLYGFETEVVLPAGESIDVQSYTLTYQDLHQEPVRDRLITEATVAVHRDDTLVTTLRPRVEQYAGFAEQTAAVPALRVSPREDLYLVLAGWSGGGEAVTLKAIINPLAGFLWLGGLVLLAGGGVALWPKPGLDEGPQSATGRRWANTARVVGVTAGLLALVAAAVTLWGPGQPATDSVSLFSPRTARLGSGDEATDFSLRRLDGSLFRLADIRGQIVVINFWTTWCVSCEEELSDLQGVWTEYADRGVVLVGIAVQEEKNEVQEMAARFGVTYPLGLDPAGRIAQPYGITGVPETFVIDARGQVAYVHVGPVSAESLRREIDGLLDE